MNKHTHLDTHIHTRMHRHTQMHTNTNMHTHTHTHTHTHLSLAVWQSGELAQSDDDVVKHVRQAKVCRHHCTLLEAAHRRLHHSLLNTILEHVGESSDGRPPQREEEVTVVDGARGFEVGASSWLGTATENHLEEEEGEEEEGGGGEGGGGGGGGRG